MKTRLFLFSISISVIALSSSAFADIKIKAKQTMSGQSYETTTYIKGKRQRNESFGGMVNITQCDMKRGIQLNANSRTYLVSQFAPTAPTSGKLGTWSADKDGVVQTGGRILTTVTIKDTGERKPMFGYTARHLIITMEMVSSPDACAKSNMKMQTDGWYIDAAFALDCGGENMGQNFASGRVAGCRDRYEMKTIGTAKRGYPVYEKTTMFDANGRESYTMVNEVVELSNAVVDASLFEVPAGYKEVFDISQMYALH